MSETMSDILLKNVPMNRIKTTLPMKKIWSRLASFKYRLFKPVIYAARQYASSEVKYCYVDLVIKVNGKRRVCRIEVAGDDAVNIESVSCYEHGSSFIHKKTIGSYNPMPNEVIEVAVAGNMSLYEYIQANDMKDYIKNRYVRVVFDKNY